MGLVWACTCILWLGVEGDPDGQITEAQGGAFRPYRRVSVLKTQGEDCGKARALFLQGSEDAC